MPKTSAAAKGGSQISWTDSARAALTDGFASGTEAGVGDFIGSHDHESGLLVFEFECLLAGYPGWRWTVIASVTESGEPTVCDAVLLPGDAALVPPAWVPWRERIQPGDLAPGDILPADPADQRLLPGYTGADTDPDDQEADVLDAVWELGLGRERVLSPYGRDVAVDRWLASATGPDTAMAKQAPHPCSTCGFFIGISGSFNRQFGVCANELSPADGKVVNIAFGCGAHSSVEPVTAPAVSATLDELEYETFERAGEFAAHVTDAAQGEAGLRADEVSNVADFATDAASGTHADGESANVREHEEGTRGGSGAAASNAASGDLSNSTDDGTSGTQQPVDGSATDSTNFGE